MAVDLSHNSSSSSAHQQPGNAGDECLIATGSADSSDLYLFDETRLNQLTKWPTIQRKLEKLNLLARPLKQSDFENGYLNLLRQLTEVGDISRDEFEKRFNQMKQINNLMSQEQYIIVVIEDRETKNIVAASTLFLELKFIHKCAVRGRLEEVAVLDTYRGKGIGLIIVDIIVQLAKEIYQCYKLTLDCTDELMKFYSLNNFTHGSNMVCIRFQ